MLAIYFSFGLVAEAYAARFPDRTIQPERAGLVGGLSFMTHLVYGAISVACATAIMYVVSLSELRQYVAASGIKLTEAELRAINGGTLDTPSAHAVISRLSPGEAETVHRALSAAFDSGMSMAFVFSALSVSVGLVLALLLDEKKLHRIES